MLSSLCSWPLCLYQMQVLVTPRGWPWDRQDGAALGALPAGSVQGGAVSWDPVVDRDLICWVLPSLLVRAETQETSSKVYSSLERSPAMTNIEWAQEQEQGFSRDV